MPEGTNFAVDLIAHMGGLTTSHDDAVPCRVEYLRDRKVDGGARTKDERALRQSYAVQPAKSVTLILVDDCGISGKSAVIEMEATILVSPGWSTATPRGWRSLPTGDIDLSEVRHAAISADERCRLRREDAERSLPQQQRPEQPELGLGRQSRTGSRSQRMRLERMPTA
jgi:hypothetical protein